MDVGEDVTRLALKFLNDIEINGSKDTEDAVSEQNACCIEDEVVGVTSTKGTSENGGDDELDRLKREADSQRQPENVLWLDARNEVDPKSERDGEQNILIDFPNTKFPTERVARTKIEGDKVDIRFEVWNVVSNGQWKNDHINNSKEIDAKDKREERQIAVFTS